MDLQLKGLCALVLGSSRGLGFATARGLALEGCQVAINSRDPENLKEVATKLARATGNTIFPVPGDVTDPFVPSLIVKKTAETFGRLDLIQDGKKAVT